MWLVWCADADRKQTNEMEGVRTVCTMYSSIPRWDSSDRMQHTIAKYWTDWS